MTHEDYMIRSLKAEQEETQRIARAIGCTCEEDYMPTDCPVHVCVDEEDEEEVTEIRPVDPLLLDACTLRPRPTVRAMSAVQEPLGEASLTDPVGLAFGE